MVMSLRVSQLVLGEYRFITESLHYKLKECRSFKGLKRLLNKDTAELHQEKCRIQCFWWLTHTNSRSKSIISKKLFSNLKGPAGSLILPHLSGFTTSASSLGSQSGSGSVSGVQLLNTNTTTE